METEIDPVRAERMKSVAKNAISACQRLFKGMSDAVVGTVADMYEDRGEEDPDRIVRVLLKENRHMYLALTVILVLTLYTLFFRG